MASLIKPGLLFKTALCNIEFPSKSSIEWSAPASSNTLAISIKFYLLTPMFPAVIWRAVNPKLLVALIFAPAANKTFV